MHGIKYDLKTKFRQTEVRKLSKHEKLENFKSFEDGKIFFLNSQRLPMSLFYKKESVVIPNGY